MKSEKIEQDIDKVREQGLKIGINLNLLVINKKKLLRWRDIGVKYCQFTDQQINNPSKIKGYIGRKLGLKVYIK